MAKEVLTRPATLSVRDMRFSDLSQVTAIERASYPVAWSEHMFSCELGRKGGIYLVAEEGGHVIGYVMVSQQADVWHVLNLTVHPDRRGRRLGEILLRSLFRRADRRPHRGFTLEVRVSNDPAIRLYRRLGFADQGIRRRYYSDNGEDAIIMWRAGEPEDA